MDRQGFEAGRASIWAQEAAISADGALIDAAHKAQKTLIQALSNLSEAIEASNAQEWLVTAHRQAIAATHLIGRLRMQTPADDANEQRLKAGAR